MAQHTFILGVGHQIAAALGVKVGASLTTSAQIFSRGSPPLYSVKARVPAH